MALVNFNKPGQRLPTAAIGPAYQAGMTNINEFAPDQDMVNALLQRGSSTAPVQSNKEGMYRALQGVLGGYMKGRDKRDLQSQRDAYGEAVMGALMASTPTEGTVGKAERIVTPTDTRLGVTDPDMLQTELPPPQQSILDDPSVPDVASLGLERIETPTGPGGQIIEQQYVPGTPGTPGGLQPMLDALRGDGTRDPRLQSALNETALMMQYGGLQDKAAQEAAELAYQRQLGLVKPTKPSSLIQDYEFARSQGYAGTLVDFHDARKVTPYNPDAITDQNRFDQYKRAEESLSEAEQNLLDIGQMERLVGETRTGTGRSLTLSFQKLALALGVGNIDENDVAAAEALRSKGMDFILQRIQKTKGAISEKEMKAFEAASAGIKNTPEGNRRILALARHVAGRNQARAEAIRQAYNRGDSVFDADNAGRAAMEEFSKNSGEYSQLTTVNLIPDAAVDAGLTQAQWNGMSQPRRDAFNAAGN